MHIVLRFCLMSFVAMMLITSCSKEDINVSEVENYTSEAVYTIEKSARCGKRGCFEFVWPITISFPDESTSEVDSQEALREAIRTWKEANPDAEERPELVFPLEIMNEDGEILSLASREELQEVIQSCPGRFGHHGKHPRNHCFEINFPVTIGYPDGTEELFDDRRSLKSALRTWKEANPDAEERPELVFPINITMKETEEVVSVSSKEELQAIKEGCRNE